MARVAALGGADAAETGPPEEALLPAARLRLEAAERRVRRLEEQRQGEGEVERLRARGDLLLAKLHEVPRGAAEVVLRGWEGEEVRIALDPTLTPAENATAWYAEARKRERAAARLPALVASAEAEAERWRRAVAAGERGELPEWVAGELSRGADGRGRPAEGTSLPYRVFRSSGGLEIRVGRSSKANDQLTFGHSTPNDVWLHARSVPGSHVILRWRDPEGAPPARDLEEAARLAAHYSKARSSGIVPVDWTRRKYVRKPRGAPPGSVIPQRVRTIFVEPGEGKSEE
jgi:predicted ribosome quality control (RQC) complex YloA/Tae2 family protein